MKECLVDSAVLLCPKKKKKKLKKQAFEHVPLSRRTVTRKIEDIAGNLELQLQLEMAGLFFSFFSFFLGFGQEL